VERKRLRRALEDSPPVVLPGLVDREAMGDATQPWTAPSEGDATRLWNPPSPTPYPADRTLSRDAKCREALQDAESAAMAAVSSANERKARADSYLALLKTLLTGAEAECDESRRLCEIAIQKANGIRDAVKALYP